MMSFQVFIFLSSCSLICYSKIISAIRHENYKFLHHESWKVRNMQLRFIMMNMASTLTCSLLFLSRARCERDELSSSDA